MDKVGVDLDKGFLHSIRSGTHSVVWGMLLDVTGWEVTIAEFLSGRGYTTRMFGKWHLGDAERRFSTDQGFDEWYGIANTADEATYAEGIKFDEEASFRPYILPSRKGQKSQKAKEYTRETRAEIDSELTDKTNAFTKRQKKKQRPFFAYAPYPLPHIPAVPSKAFEGKTGNGR